MLKEKPLGLIKSNKQIRQAPRRRPFPQDTLESLNSPHLPVYNRHQLSAQAVPKLDHCSRARGQDLQSRKGESSTITRQAHHEADSLDSLDLLGDSSSFLSYQQPETPEIVARSSRPSWFGASTEVQQRSLARSLLIGSSTSKAFDEFRKLHDDLSGIIESLSPTMDSAHNIISSLYTPPKSKPDNGHLANTPAFGKPSAIHSPLIKDKSIFNVPKSHRPRPEHHRAGPKAETIPQSQGPREGFAIPQEVMIPKPNKSLTARLENNSQLEEVRNAPLFTRGVKYANKTQVVDVGQRGIANEDIFPQYGLIGFREPPLMSHPDEARFEADRDLIYANMNAPWSTFICGSRGAGGSHTFSCLFENALLSPNAGGVLPDPLTGIVFHYDKFTSHSSAQLCEGAYLCSIGIPVQVSVSPSNRYAMQSLYENFQGLPRAAPRPQVRPLMFHENHLNVANMRTLMAVDVDVASPPLCLLSLKMKCVSVRAKR